MFDRVGWMSGGSFGIRRAVASTISLLAVCLVAGKTEAQTVSVIAAATPLNTPFATAVDGGGNIYVANSHGPGGPNSNVIKLTPDGHVLTVFTDMTPSPTGSPFPPSVTAVALDPSGNVVVADTINIYRIATGGAVSIIAGPDQGLDGPSGLAFDSTGNLFVTNNGTNTISKITPSGAISTFIDAQQGLLGPTALTFDSNGNLFVANTGGDAVMKITPDGSLSFVQPPRQGFIMPRGLAFDSSGNLFVATIMGVFEISPDGSIATRDQREFERGGLAVAANGNVLVTVPFENALTAIAPSGTISTLLRGTLPEPSGIAVDTAGNIYVSCFEANTVMKITPAGAVSTFVDATQGLKGPVGLALDSSGNLFVANSNGGSISKVTPSGSASTFAGAANGISQPAGLAFDRSGNLFIADIGDGSIRKIAPSGSVSVFASPTSVELAFFSPLAIDATGTVFVAGLGPDERASIVKVTPDGTVSDFLPGVVNGRSFGATALAVDATGNLFVGQGDLITEITPNGTLAATFTSTPDATTPQLIQAGAFAFDRSNHLVVADESSDSVLQIAFPSSPLAAAVLPGSRSVEIGATATVFATMINASDSPLSNCGAELPFFASTDLSMSFQTTAPATNALTGMPNQAFDLPAHGTQTFLLSFQSTVPVTASGLAPVFFCQDVTPASAITGVNTVDLLFSATPVADVIALAATATNDGTAHLAQGRGAFAVATVNVGTANVLTVSADTGSASLPLSLSLCETGPTGQCLAPPSASLSTTITANATPTFSIFATAGDQIPFDPATSRVFLRFKDSSGTSHGSTSVAVTTT